MRRRPLLLAILLVALLGAAACEPQKPGLGTAGLDPAPAPTPPATDAAPDTWRADAETWIRLGVYPKVLGRTPSDASVRSWADRAVRTSTASVTASFAATTEARQRSVGYAFDRVLGRAPSSADSTYWAGQLAKGWTEDRLIAFLTAGGEFTRAHPSNTDWVKAVFTRLLGRTADSGAISYYTGRLAKGESRTQVAGSVQTSTEGRRRVLAIHYPEVVGIPLTTDRRDFYVARLASLGGDESALRADLVLAFAPRPLRAGVVGDSVAWDLAAHVGSEKLPAIVGSTFLRNGAALGCGVFGPEKGYLYRYSDGTWYSPGDGWCAKNLPPREQAMLDQGVDVLVWPLGAWEQGDVRTPGGTVLPARSAAMRTALVDEIVKRIDGYRLRGVKRVVFPEFACIRQQGVMGTDDYSRFIRTVIDGVVADRPSLASVGETTPQVCVGGDPLAESTLDHAKARDDDGVHWRVGAVGAAWAWRAWIVPAIADTPGLTG